jgi:D-amino-acid dehydrogenase
VTGRPAEVAVVGAGIVGLATAWFLQEYAIRVTVLEAEQIGAGASWGNAGWLTPALATPLPEPSLLKFGLQAVLSPSSPVHVPLRPDAQLLRFLSRFARHCTPSRWRAAMQGLIPLNSAAIAAYDKLSEGGVTADTIAAEPFMAAFRTGRGRDSMLRKIEHMEQAGQAVQFEVLTGSQARDLEPCLSEEIQAGLKLLGQRYVDPGAYVQSLARSVRDRGGKILEHTAVSGIRERPGGVSIQTAGPTGGLDVAVGVIATGARLGALAGSLGLGLPIQSGRGYSFSVKVENQPRGPIYFPVERIACTPWQGRLRVTGMMEFAGPEQPMDARRLDTVANAAAPVLRGARMADRHDEWVGARPCTWDGLPLVGHTRSPRLYVAAGHAMFGMTLGPVTGQFLAEEIATGRQPRELAPFSPLR